MKRLLVTTAAVAAVTAPALAPTAAHADSEFLYKPKRVVVPGCSGVERRSSDGDQNGDERADVLGIQAGTGDLYYYRMTNKGLAPGIKAGTGWNKMIFMQQVTELYSGTSDDYLVAVRDDRTIWRYKNMGQGRFANGTKLATLPADTDNFTVDKLNNPSHFGQHALLARQGSTLKRWIITADGLKTDQSVMATGWGNTTKTLALGDFNTDLSADLVSIRRDGTIWLSENDGNVYAESTYSRHKKVGHGWHKMGIVTSPGSVDGDQLPDLIARRDDGKLYRYGNHRGQWGPAEQIGFNWKGIRLLA